MCLAIPAKLIKKENEKDALVDFGDGTMRKVNVSLVEAEEGQYLLVHAGFAIEVLEEKDAKETLRIWDEILNE
ncbi:MAG: HypC/HybG/HupF family hydrogenase formation chaperone [Candidatus Bathyarchaeota archaeon]|jgi:hydrogenase expression/formation protein HypC|nr:HypC/HybG/HupF family hydrogenase formation chaperone [Candidatus Bathyarchaeota archaeon]